MAESAAASEKVTQDLEDGQAVAEEKVVLKADGGSSAHSSPSKIETTEALQHLVQGKRHLLVRDVHSAVNSLQEACRLLAQQYGDSADQCGEAYFVYGRALLELSRLETGVLGNALDGVPEGEDADTSQTEDPDKLTEEEREDVVEKVDSALEENFHLLERVEQQKSSARVAAAAAEAAPGSVDAVQDALLSKKADDAAKPIQTEEEAAKPPVPTEEEAAKPAVPTEEEAAKPAVPTEEGASESAVTPEEGTLTSAVTADEGASTLAATADEGISKPAVTVDEGLPKDAVTSDEGASKPAVVVDEGASKPVVVADEGTSKPDVSAGVELLEGAADLTVGQASADSEQGVTEVNDQQMEEADADAEGSNNSEKEKSDEVCTEEKKAGAENGEEKQAEEKGAGAAGAADAEGQPDAEKMDTDGEQTSGEVDAAVPAAATTEDSPMSPVADHPSTVQEAQKPDSGDGEEENEESDDSEEAAAEPAGDAASAQDDGNEAAAAEDADGDADAGSGSPDDAKDADVSQDCEATEDADADGDADGEGEGEDGEDDVSNIQLAWEVLELAKLIFSRQARDASTELRLAEVYLKLGEVSIEAENYTRAVDDLSSCLQIQKKHLAADDRLVAETHYHTGVAHSLANEYSQAIQSFQASVDTILARIQRLNAQIVARAKGEAAGAAAAAATAADPFYTEEAEIKELEQLLPDMREKIADMRDMKAEAERKLLQTLAAAGGAGPSGSSTAPISPVKALMRPPQSTPADGATSGAAADADRPKPTSILVKRKRPSDTPTEQQDAEQKRSRQENGHAADQVTTNGHSDSGAT